MIVDVFWVLDSRNLVVCILAQLMVCFFFFLYASRESKKMPNNFGNVFITCSNSVNESIEIYKKIRH